MVNYALKKLGYHFAICLIAWFLILKFSPYTGIYAGWFSGFLSACYLLAGWLSYLKSKGTDFGKLLRRKKPVMTPGEMEKTVIDLGDVTGDVVVRVEEG